MVIIRGEPWGNKMNSCCLYLDKWKVDTYMILELGYLTTRLDQASCSQKEKSITYKRTTCTWRYSCTSLTKLVYISIFVSTYRYLLVGNLHISTYPWGLTLISSIKTINDDEINPSILELWVFSWNLHVPIHKHTWSQWEVIYHITFLIELTDSYCTCWST